MTQLVPPALLERIREYRAASFTGRPAPLAEIRSQIAAIPDEAVRTGALERLHIMLVCATVMKVDPLNYQRAVGRACDNLVTFLNRAERMPAPQPVSSEAEPVPTNPGTGMCIEP